MRSYYDHLKSMTAETLHKKYHFRSSAIFPVFQSNQVKTRLLFMGYWVLKRQIKELSAVATLRSETGQTLNKKLFTIQDPKAYTIEVEDELKKAFKEMPVTFIGSLEIEFFSSVNLTFPFPAVVINYYHSNFSTLVHTAQRVYNNWEDMRDNTQAQVPEAGFNIYADSSYEPFFALVNGPEECPEFRMDMIFYNNEKQALKKTLNFGDLAPYQTLIIYPDRQVDLKQFLKGKVGSAKVKFSLNWIYPRLIVGNVRRQNSEMSITHTYYDCSTATSSQDYWPITSHAHAPASLMVPVDLTSGHSTKLYFYPIYTPAEFTLNLEIYNDKGEIKGRKNHVLKIDKNVDYFQIIDLKEICEELKIDRNQPLAAKILAAPLLDQIPARVKLGLDLGHPPALPCNICTNLQPYNPSLENKTESFKWGPILADQPHTKIYIMNSSPDYHYSKEAQLLIHYYREVDNETYAVQKVLPPHGFLVIDPNQDDQLKKFLNKRVGWYTVKTSNPYTTTYYFNESSSGAIGGDHGF